MQRNKIMLIGGAGFIGSILARQLIKDNDVIIYDGFIQYISPLCTDYNDYLRYRFKGISNNIISIRGDTRDATFLRRTIFDQKPDYIVHLAALPIANISNKNSDETYSSILTGLVNTLEILRDIDYLKRFVYISSSMVYGNFKNSFPKENHTTEPINLYGCYKLCGEIVTRTYGNKYDIPFSIVRPSAVYGPTDLNNRVSQIFIESVLNNKQIIINGKDTYLDFTFVKDTVQGIKKVLFSQNAIGETFNITYGIGHTLLEFVKILEKFTNKNVNIIIQNKDKSVPKRGALSIYKAKVLVNYEPIYSLEDGIKEYLKFYEEIKNV